MEQASYGGECLVFGRFAASSRQTKGARFCCAREGE
jgi:hypothetical protein